MPGLIAQLVEARQEPGLPRKTRKDNGSRWIFVNWLEWLKWQFKEGRTMHSGSQRLNYLTVWMEITSSSKKRWVGQINWFVKRSDIFLRLLLVSVCCFDFVREKYLMINLAYYIHCLLVFCRAISILAIMGSWKTQKAPMLILQKCAFKDIFDVSKRFL